MADARTPPALRIRFVQDDLGGEEVQALVARHLRGMHERSPPESVHAFGAEQLRAPDVTFWTAWVDAPDQGLPGRGLPGEGATGTTPDFAPALQLYRSAGFVDCGPFADYAPDRFSAFMTRTL